MMSSPQIAESRIEWGDFKELKNEDFLACLAFFAHEARNPLAVIQQTVDWLRLAEPNSNVHREALARIRRQVYHLNRLIGDLSDFSAGNLGLFLEETTLTDVWGSAIDLTHSLFDAKSQILMGQPPEGEIRLLADRVRLAQVFANLLANASKYSPDGSSVWSRFETNGNSLVVRIKDAGAGIDPEVLPRIFEPFFRGDDATRYAVDGMGIGLAITKRIVALHSGSIDAKSDGEGKGSEFRVTLPIS